MLKGIDVSSYQTASYSTSGLSFVGIKVTEGISYVNSKWVAQRATARAAGLVTIFYHYPHITNSATTEADYFLSQINLAAGDVLCLDWEWYGQNVTDAQARAYKDAWITRVRSKAPGHKVIVYCDRNSWLNVDTNSNAGDGLWIADYVTAGKPRIQAEWLFHQYTDTPQDTDVANFATVTDLKAWAGSATPTPKPTPAPAPAVPQWQKLLEHVMAVPEQVYETWTSPGGWNNVTPFGAEYGENGVSWCVIFAWDMFHDLNLEGIVPKTDNVSSFTSWAQARGQWSEYPSVGAWCNFGNSAHCELVVGFDSTTVYTKGGNSLETGAVDNGQGNGVWSHSHARTDPYVTGYFAPRFPDGHCPPTADPNDPRGGKAVTAYTPPEADVPLSADDITKVAQAVFDKLAASGGVLENSDLDRIWQRDVIPAAVPPYNNPDYYGPDGKTPQNTTWTATYTQYTQVMGIREAVARLKNLEGAVGDAQLSDAQVAALANQVAASSALVDLIAEKVAENIAARLAQ